MKKDRKKIIPIKKELAPVLEAFLKYEEYEEIFKKFAKIAGYHGTNKDRMYNILFTPTEEGEIVFTVDGLYELFTEYQLIMELSDKEPYKSLLKEYPEAIRNIRKIAEKVLRGKDLHEEDLTLMFDTDNYDKIRKQLPKEDNGSEQVQAQPNSK